LDGFLVLMSTLSTTETRPQASSPVSEPEEQVLADAIEGIRLAFMVASEAMYDHAENTDYFNVSGLHDKSLLIHSFSIRHP
jgi:hypothetical protein